jgi:hypothetical protein
MREDRFHGTDACEAWLVALEDAAATVGDAELRFDALSDLLDAMRSLEQGIAPDARSAPALQELRRFVDTWNPEAGPSAADEPRLTHLVRQLTALHRAGRGAP